MQVATPLAAFDWQTVMLGYLGQQAIAHAALVFATLAAAFTFASGFANRSLPAESHDRKAKGLSGILSRIKHPPALYLGFNWVLLWPAAYAAGRTVFYGAMANQVMLVPINDTCINSLAEYW